MLKQRFAIGVGVLITGLLVSPVVGSSVTQTSITAGQSTENVAAFEGSVEYDPADADGELTVSLTNTTAGFDDGGSITGLALNLPDSATGGSLVKTNEPATGFSDADGSVKASPFGTYAFGAITGNNWRGGSPGSGLADDKTGTLTFDITGDTDKIVASDFLTVGERYNPSEDGEQQSEGNGNNGNNGNGHGNNSNGNANNGNGNNGNGNSGNNGMGPGVTVNGQTYAMPDTDANGGESEKGGFVKQTESTGTETGSRGIAVRFQAIGSEQNDESDKVLGAVVPAPAPVWAGLALLGALLVIHRRRNSAH